jgi:hypothetical protein
VQADGFAEQVNVVRLGKPWGKVPCLIGPDFSHGDLFQAAQLVLICTHGGVFYSGPCYFFFIHVSKLFISFFVFGDPSG